MSGTCFPAGFLWGAATSAYQIEGSPLADGAGESIWHRFSHRPGATFAGETGDLACDHYRRWRDDVALMRELGLPAYRFSLSWGRILPAGRGKVNPKGLDFYARLVDALLESGIRPMATLYHWDLPAALDDLGGWVNPDSAHWFEEYAAVAFRALADRVPLWVTLNEPYMIADAGYLRGFHAPGHRSLEEAARASVNLARAHGAAVRAYRGHGRGEIGLVVNLEPKHPATPEAADRAAAARADAYMNRQWLDPVLLGRYPEELKAIYGSAWREPSEADFELMRRPLDFVGVNYYSRSRVAHDPGARPAQATAVRPADAPHTEMGWEIYPDGLRETLCGVTERYGKLPLYVTENGAAFADPAPGADGVVEDPARVEYFRAHLQAAQRAIELGVDLRGYFAWSLLDNFEWQYGYSKRFGLVQVDFANQRRRLKRSALFYREVVRTNGAGLHASRGGA